LDVVLHGTKIKLMCRFTNRKKANLWGVKRPILKVEGGSEQKKRPNKSYTPYQHKHINIFP